MNIDRSGKHFQAFALRVGIWPQSGDALVSEALFAELECVNTILLDHGLGLISGTPKDRQAKQREKYHAKKRETEAAQKRG